MKTAISIPDDLFEEADALARTLGTSRSELYSRAVREFVAAHCDETVTQRLDAVLSHIDEDSADVVAAGVRTLADVEW